MGAPNVRGGAVTGPRMWVGWALLLTVASVTGCDTSESLSRNLCPKSLVGRTANEGSNIQWGKGEPKIEARTASVALECLRIRNPAVQTTKIKREAYTTYSIAATAQIMYKINDADFLQTSIR
jgi:hypothetical protein